MDRPPRRRIAIAAVLASATAASSCAGPGASTTPAPPRPPGRVAPAPADPSDLAGAVVEAHNARRARRGLPPLAPSSALDAAAIEHAEGMAARGRMAHKGADGSSPFDRIRRQGYEFRSAAENVAYGFEGVDAVMDGWMRSPGHRRNILGDYAEIGVGRATGRDGASYWCVTFGTPSGR